MGTCEQLSWENWAALGGAGHLCGSYWEKGDLGRSVRERGHNTDTEPSGGVGKCGTEFAAYSGEL